MQRQGSIGQSGAWILGIVFSASAFGGLYGLLKNYTPKSSRSVHSASEESNGHGIEKKDGHDSSEGKSEHNGSEEGASEKSTSSHGASEKESSDSAHGTKEDHGGSAGHTQGAEGHSSGKHEGKSASEGDPKGDSSPDGRVHEAELAQKEKERQGKPTDKKAKTGVHWTYEGRLGPKFWGKLVDDFVTCEKGTKQSPLDLVDADQDARLQPIDFHYEAQDISFENNGHTLLAKFQGSGNYIRHGDDKYNLVQFHVHAPSEHFVDGAPYDLEVHLVHQNAAGKLLVVGVLMEALGKGSPALESLWKDLPLSVGTRGPTIKFTPDALLPKKREYWSYDGSLTTPPCTEGVKWYVMSHPIQISVRQVDQFQAAYRKNSRPPQTLQGRKILKTRSF
jgi:carbonic anhydrase